MATSNKLRALNRMPYDFEDGLKVRGVDVEHLLGGVTKHSFAGNGVNKVFTLPVTPSNKDVVDIYIKQLYVHSTDFTLVDNVITFAEAPPAVLNGELYNVEIKVGSRIL